MNSTDIIGYVAPAEGIICPDCKAHLIEKELGRWAQRRYDLIELLPLRGEHVSKKRRAFQRTCDKLTQPVFADGMDEWYNKRDRSIQCVWCHEYIEDPDEDYTERYEQIEERIAGYRDPERHTFCLACDHKYKKEQCEAIEVSLIDGKPMLTGGLDTNRDCFYCETLLLRVFSDRLLDFYRDWGNPWQYEGRGDALEEWKTAGLLERDAWDTLLDPLEEELEEQAKERKLLFEIGERVYAYQDKGFGALFCIEHDFFASNGEGYTVVWDITKLGVEHPESIHRLHPQLGLSCKYCGHALLEVFSKKLLALAADPLTPHNPVRLHALAYWQDMGLLNEEIWQKILQPIKELEEELEEEEEAEE